MSNLPFTIPPTSASSTSQMQTSTSRHPLSSYIPITNNPSASTSIPSSSASPQQRQHQHQQHSHSHSHSRSGAVPLAAAGSTVRGAHSSTLPHLPLADQFIHHTDTQAKIKGKLFVVASQLISSSS